MIYLLTGAVQSGKTTALAAWARRRSDAAGLLQPVRDGGRFLVAWPSAEERALETESAGEKAVRIGRFRFSEAAFAWGRNWLAEAARREPAWLFVDEIGPLELRGEGLAPVDEAVLAARRGARDAHGIAVVRERLLEDARRRYGPEGTRVIGPEALRPGGRLAGKDARPG